MQTSFLAYPSQNDAYTPYPDQPYDSLTDSQARLYPEDSSGPRDQSEFKLMQRCLPTTWANDGSHVAIARAKHLILQVKSGQNSWCIDLSLLAEETGLDPSTFNGVLQQVYLQSSAPAAVNHAAERLLRLKTIPQQLSANNEDKLAFLRENILLELGVALEKPSRWILPLARQRIALLITKIFNKKCVRGRDYLGFVGEAAALYNDQIVPICFKAVRIEQDAQSSSLLEDLAQEVQATTHIYQKLYPANPYHPSSQPWVESSENLGTLLYRQASYFAYTCPLKHLPKPPLAYCISLSREKNWQTVIYPRCNGGSLADHIDAQRKKTGPDPYITPFIYQTILGVEKLHNLRCIHHDLKPSNILIHHRQERSGQIQEIELYLNDAESLIDYETLRGYAFNTPRKVIHYLRSLKMTQLYSFPTDQLFNTIRAYLNKIKGTSNLEHRKAYFKNIWRLLELQDLQALAITILEITSHAKQGSWCVGVHKTIPCQKKLNLLVQKVKTKACISELLLTRCQEILNYQPLATTNPLFSPPEHFSASYLLHALYPSPEAVDQLEVPRDPSEFTLEKRLERQS